MTQEDQSGRKDSDSTYGAGWALFNRLSQNTLQEMIARADTLLGFYEDGEVFLEYRQTSHLVWEEDRIKTSSFKITQGMGIRGMTGAHSHFVHNNDLSAASLKEAQDLLAQMPSETEVTVPLSHPAADDYRLYPADNPLEDYTVARQVQALKEAVSYARAKEKSLIHTQAQLSLEWQVIGIIRRGGFIVFDVRPLGRFGALVSLEDHKRVEAGFDGYGGRDNRQILEPVALTAAFDRAIAQARTNLHSVAMEAGTMDVVLGPGWPGVLLHEAIGHGLEGDHIRKKSSAFTDLLGTPIASDAVTIVDDGRIKGARGSLHIDDEGTPTQTTTLIEKGKLTGFLYDRQNAALMGKVSTGNGRRQSYAYRPIPRMLNTYMLAGTKDPQSILRGVQKGIYAVSFGGGQVNTTTGQFVFDCQEAYELIGGRLGRPLKNATITGIGSEALKKIVAVGRDSALDKGVGLCGKDGQTVPVGVGQPTLHIQGLVVGGTAGG